MRLFVNKKSTGLSATTMNKLCKGKAVQLKQIEEDDDNDPYKMNYTTQKNLENMNWKLAQK